MYQGTHPCIKEHIHVSIYKDSLVSTGTSTCIKIQRQPCINRNTSMYQYTKTALYQQEQPQVSRNTSTYQNPKTALYQQERGLVSKCKPKSPSRTLCTAEAILAELVPMRRHQFYIVAEYSNTNHRSKLIITKGRYFIFILRFC